MSDQLHEPLVTENDDDEAFRRVKDDLEASERFKDKYWPTDKIQNRRRAYEGDPEAFGWPYPTDEGQHRPFNNFIFRQINHKVSKLQGVRQRLNLRHRKGMTDEETRLRLNAVKERLLQKGREAKWQMGRKLMMLDSAKTGFGVRCVGLAFDGRRYVFRNWRVRGEEFHMDPLAETPDDAEWKSWRRYVSTTRIPHMVKKHGVTPSGLGGSLETDGRPQGIALSTDKILAFGRGLDSTGSPTSGLDTNIVTDYYRRDASQDYYYPCPHCDQYTGISRVESIGSDRPVPDFKCANCGKRTDPKRIDKDRVKRMPRYPHGRHIRLIEDIVDYNGRNKLRLQDGDPFVGMTWYDGEAWPGYSETHLVSSPQLLLNIALAALSDNAIDNAHQKVQFPQDGIISGWNNNPADPLIVSTQCWASGGGKPVTTGEVSGSVRLLLEYAMSHLYLIPGLSPESQGQAPETLRSGVGVARIQAASEVGLVLPLDSLINADARFYRIVRDLCSQFDVSADIPMLNDAGVPGIVEYDRTLMAEPFDIEILTDQEVDQRREEFFSRAMEMRMAQVQGIDDSMLLELSGIPDDMILQARQRTQAAFFQNQEAGLPPSISLGTAGSPNDGSRPGSQEVGGVSNRMAGRLAPRPTRPPARSRGVEALMGAPTNGAGR